MSRLMPSIDEERTAAAASLADVTLPAPAWRRSRPISRITFFVLTLLAVGAFVLLLGLFAGPERLPFVCVVTASVSLCLAETLIVRMKMFGAGPEEALWVSAMISIAVLIVTNVTSLHFESDLLIFAIAIGTAGLRMRNAFFTTLALPGTLPFIWREYGHDSSAVAALAVALVATIVAMSKLRRPSSQAMADFAMIVMPVAAFACLKTDLAWSDSQPIDLRSTAIFTALALLFVTTGLVRRMHAPLIAAMPCVVIVAWECRHLTGLVFEWRLILWGAMVLVASVIAERLLRGRTRGLTSDELQTRPEIALIDIAAPAIAGMQVHSASAHTTPTDHLGGSSGGRDSFGGAGASGDY
jgi:hypothetical protein